MAPTKSNGRFWDIATKITVPLVFLAAGSLVAHEIRLTTVEASRFTESDGARLEHRLDTKLVEMMKELHELIHKLNKDMDTRLRAIEVKVGK